MAVNDLGNLEDPDPTLTRARVVLEIDVFRFVEVRATADAYSHKSYYWERCIGRDKMGQKTWIEADAACHSTINGLVGRALAFGDLKR